MPITPAARERLAEAIEDRRLELALRLQDVAEAAGISLKTLHSVRTGDKGIAPLTQIGLARALHWTPDSVKRILDGLDPEELPVIGSAGAHASKPPIAADLAAEDISDDQLAPFIAGVWHEVGAAVAEHHTENPAGAQIFDDPQEQRIWDSNDRRLRTREEKVRLIALLRFLEDETVNGQANGAETGLVRS